MPTAASLLTTTVPTAQAAAAATSVDSQGTPEAQKSPAFAALLLAADSLQTQVSGDGNGKPAGDAAKGAAQGNGVAQKGASESAQALRIMLSGTADAQPHVAPEEPEEKAKADAQTSESDSAGQTPATAALSKVVAKLTDKNASPEKPPAEAPKATAETTPEAKAKDVAPAASAHAAVQTPAAEGAAQTSATAALSAALSKAPAKPVDKPANAEEPPATDDAEHTTATGDTGQTPATAAFSKVIAKLTDKAAEAGGTPQATPKPKAKDAPEVAAVVPAPQAASAPPIETPAAKAAAPQSVTPPADASLLAAAKANPAAETAADGKSPDLATGTQPEGTSQKQPLQDNVAQAVLPPNAVANARDAVTSVLTKLQTPTDKNPQDAKAANKADKAAQTAPGPKAAQAAAANAPAQDAKTAPPGDTAPTSASGSPPAAAAGPSGHTDSGSLSSSGVSDATSSPTQIHRADVQALPLDGTSRGDTQIPVVVVRAPGAHGAASAPSLPTAQLAVMITRQMSQGINHFEIRLDPPELGRIDVRLDVSHQGHVMATLSADRPETLDLLQRDARTLQRTLTDAGLNTNSDSLNFTMREHSHQQNARDDSWQNRSAPASAAAKETAPGTQTVTYVASLEPGRLDVRV